MAYGKWTDFIAVDLNKEHIRQMGEGRYLIEVPNWFEAVPNTDKSEKHINELLLTCYHDELFDNDCKPLHYYIQDDRLLEWFHENDVRPSAEALSSLLKDEKNIIFLVHAHREWIYFCFINEKETCFYGQCAHERKILHCATNKFEKTYKEAKGDVKLIRYMNFMYNLLLYRACFPKCIVNELPSDLTKERKREMKESKEKIQSIQLSSDLLVKKNNVILPHFRKGHFRLLSSDFFTHKKGQIIFIEDTFVKGYRAKSIVDIKEKYSPRELLLQKT